MLNLTSKQMEQKYFELDGLRIYVQAPNKNLAVVMCLINSIGVTSNNLIEIERVPKNSKLIKFNMDDISKFKENHLYRNKQYDSFIS